MNKKPKPFLAHSELTDLIYIIDKDDKYEVTEQCIKAMKATNRMSRWIPVGERLPEEETDVLICNSKGQIEVSRGSTFDDGTWEWYTSGWHYGEVIAWMPLPQPYKEEGAE